jgi:hypothetical protein
MAGDNPNNQSDKEDRIDAGFRGVNARLDTLDTGFRGVNTRLDAMDTGFVGVNARLDTVDAGLTEVRADLGDLTAHVFEIRDALLADNVKNREHVSIKVEALRSEMKVYADGVIAHTDKLENHETRITKLETR